MKKLAIAAGVGLAGVALMACGFLGGSKDSDSGSGAQYSDSRFGISVDLPGGWELVDEETDSDDMTTVDFSKGDLEVSLMYTPMEGLEELGLSEGEFLDMIMEEFAGSEGTSLQTVREGTIVVDGVAGKEKVIEGTIEGSQGISRDIALFENDKMVIILFIHEDADDFSSGDKKAMKEFLNGIELDL